MKIIINSKELSNIIDRAAACATAKTHFAALECVQLSAYGGEVEALASNITESVRIWFPAEIIEEGTVLVTVPDWKKLLKADGMITIESVESIVKLTAAKKKSSITAVTDDMPEFPTVPQENPIFTAPVDELTEIFKKLNPCISRNDSRPTACGYHIYGNSAQDMVKIVAVDGFHLMRKTSTYPASGKFDIIIPEPINKSLAKIAGKSGNVTVCADRKHTSFIGKDFAYTVRNIEGEALNENNAIPTSSAGEFHIDAADVAKIAKDYIKIIGGKDAVVKVPLRLFAGEDKLILAMTHNGYSTTDEVEISESNIPTHASRFPGYYMSMFSSVYTADIFGNLDGNVTVKFGNQYAPVMIESNGYIGLLLPVREGKCDEYPYITTNNLATLAGIAMAEEVA